VSTFASPSVHLEVIVPCFVGEESRLKGLWRLDAAPAPTFEGLVPLNFGCMAFKSPNFGCFD